MKLVALAVLAAAPLLAATAGAKKPATPATKTENIRTKDVTGSYSAKGAAGSDEYTVEIVQGDNEVAVEFLGAFGISAHTCDCLMTGTAAGEGKWKLEGTSSKGTLSVFGSKLVVELEQPPECCGAGFQGAPDFKIADRKAPQTCTVKAAKAVFQNPDDKKAPLKKFVVKGDKIDAFSEGTEEAEDVILARFAGKKHTAGFLKAEDLSCPPPSPTPAPVEAETPADAPKPE